MKIKIPTLQHHRASGRARVSWQGRHIYFGRFGEAETEERYRRWCAELLTGEAQTPERGAGLSVSELAARYMVHARDYYQPDSPMHVMIKNALEPLIRLYGSTPAAEFGPKALRTVRGVWLDPERKRVLSRRTVNGYTGCVKRMFRWAASNEFVPVTTYQALATLDNLRKLRSTARETQSIEPVSQRHLDAVIAVAPRVLRDLIRVHALTGARPTEICELKRGYIDTTGPVWLATLEEHKTAWHEHAKPRIIPFGPQAQDILRPYMLRPGEAYIFDPREAVAERPAPKDTRRRPGQPETPRKSDRRVRDHYDKDSYRHAVATLCERARVPVWTPNQIRKYTASRVRERFGLDGAQVLLGHASADVTEIYARLDEARLVEIAKELG